MLFQKHTSEFDRCILRKKIEKEIFFMQLQLKILSYHQTDINNVFLVIYRKVLFKIEQLSHFQVKKVHSQLKPFLHLASEK